MGLVGVGHMGLGMARNILRKKAATMSVCVYDVSHSNLEALGAALGLHVASSVSDLTSRCDVIALSLPSQAAQDAIELINLQTHSSRPVINPPHRAERRY